MIYIIISEMVWNSVVIPHVQLAGMNKEQSDDDSSVTQLNGFSI